MHVSYLFMYRSIMALNYLSYLLDLMMSLTILTYWGMDTKCGSVYIRIEAARKVRVQLLMFACMHAYVSMYV